MAPEIQIFLLAMTPLGELRVAIPMGLAFYNLNPVTVYFLSVLGNIFAVFLILVFLSSLSCRSLFERLFGWFVYRTRKKHYNPEISNRINKYGLWFLPLFVAIPLPGTGGWTAALIAFVFGMSFKKAFLLISLGVLLAGLIVLVLTKAGITIEKYFGWQILIGIILISGFIYWLLPKNRR